MSGTRSKDIMTKQAGFLYGPPVGGGPYFPSGTLGQARMEADLQAHDAESAPVADAAALDVTAANASAGDYNDLQTLDDYTLIYDHWKNTLPSGPAPGALTNYTQDLLFSMERLSFSPYQIRRVNPESDTLQFHIEDAVAQNVSGMTLKELFQAGRLFYADYRDQKNLTSTGLYDAAVDAFFYLDPASGDFLPLAIRTNANSSLVYTPNDSPEDWLLAKIMYNVNDFWFTQWNHLASTHEVVQISYLAAIRTLSDNHPALALLDRILYEVFSFQPLAASLAFATGGGTDRIFSHTGAAAQDYTTDRYAKSGSGRFRANYFRADLRARGLLDCTFGPALKHFPFFEDASVIFDATRAFVTFFVNSYYKADADVVADNEVQAWVSEAQGPAEAIGFPSITTRDSLIDVLTHFAHLVTSSHQSINTNQILSVSSTLPFHPSALYSPPPTTKGTTASQLVKFLPPLSKALGQLNSAANFARPFFPGTNRTLLHIFDSEDFLNRTNPATQAAAATFQQKMQEFSGQVSSRRFDAHGLSQGMPFVWQALDPNVAPFSLSA